MQPFGDNQIEKYLPPGTPLIATPLIFALDMRTGRSLRVNNQSLPITMARTFGALSEAERRQAERRRPHRITPSHGWRSR